MIDIKISPHKYPPFRGTYYRMVEEDYNRQILFDHVLQSVIDVNDRKPYGLPKSCMKEFKVLAIAHNINIIEE